MTGEPFDPSDHHHHSDGDAGDAGFAFSPDDSAHHHIGADDWTNADAHVVPDSDGDVLGLLDPFAGHDVSTPFIDDPDGEPPFEVTAADEAFADQLAGWFDDVPPAPGGAIDDAVLDRLRDA